MPLRDLLPYAPAPRRGRKPSRARLPAAAHVQASFVVWLSWPALNRRCDPERISLPRWGALANLTVISHDVIDSGKFLSSPTDDHGSEPRTHGLRSAGRTTDP